MPDWIILQVILTVEAEWYSISGVTMFVCAMCFTAAVENICNEINQNKIKKTKKTKRSRWPITRFSETKDTED